SSSKDKSHLSLCSKAISNKFILSIKCSIFVLVVTNEYGLFPLLFLIDNNKQYPSKNFNSPGFLILSSSLVFVGLLPKICSIKLSSDFNSLVKYSLKAPFIPEE